MDETGVTIRFDEGRDEYVTVLNVKGFRSFEGSGKLLSDAFRDLTEQLENEGV